MSVHDDIALKIKNGEPGLLQGPTSGGKASFKADGYNILIDGGTPDPIAVFGNILDGIASKRPGFITSSTGVPKELFLNRAQAYEDSVVSDFSRSPKSNAEWARIHRAFVAEHYGAPVT